MTTYVPISTEDARSHVGEGIHTGLRRGSDAPSAPDLWEAISNSEDTAWTDAINYLLWGLDHMGMAICKKVEDEQV